MNDWIELECNDSLKEIKNKLTDLTRILQPDFIRNFLISNDTSNIAIRTNLSLAYEKGTIKY